MQQPVIATIDGQSIEYRHIGEPNGAPTLVLLHEGLGCVAMWKDFPDRLVQSSGCPVLVYSRTGYGRSDPCELPRPLSYMHDEAVFLGKLVAHFALQPYITVGHSDGGSIAAIHAAQNSAQDLRGLIMMAPHFIVEDLSVDSIASARKLYENGDLRQRLGIYHGENVDCAFMGWNRAWLDPAFREWDLSRDLESITVPSLLIQGEDDEYGTLAQIECARQHMKCPLQVEIFEGCGHSVHRDDASRTLKTIQDFIDSL